MLPNNFADFPSQPPWLESSDAGRRRRRRAARGWCWCSCWVSLVAVGVYRWVVVGDLVDRLPLALPSTHRTPPPVDDSAPPADPAQPALVTELLGNQPVSQNWSGYAATAGDYTAVSATWTVSEIARWLDGGRGRGVGRYRRRAQSRLDSGGHAANRLTARRHPARGVDRAAAAAFADGAAEDLRRATRLLVSITQQGPELWLIALTNTTSGEAYQVTKHYASSLSSAEWVEEAPSAGRGGPLPLDDFGTHHVQSGVGGARRRDGQHRPGGRARDHHDHAGVAQHLVEPSGPGADGDSFSVTRTGTPSPPPQQRFRRRP